MSCSSSARLPATIMSKKSHKSNSQQQQQQQQLNQKKHHSQQQAQPTDRAERQTSAQTTSFARPHSCDSLDASVESNTLVALASKQARGSENQNQKVSKQQKQEQPDRAISRFERDKRPKLKLASSVASNNQEKLMNKSTRMPDGQDSGASYKLAQDQASVLAKQEEANICAACAKPIRERYLLMALDKRWHEDCLKCACCDCRLGEVGSSLFTHSDKLLCRRDFLRIFGKKGLCAACHRQIPAYELVMRAQEKAYHMDCFACQRCQYRFCVGDQFHMTQAHKIICLLCHREQQHLERCLAQQQQQQQVESAARESPDAEVAPEEFSKQLGPFVENEPGRECDKLKPSELNNQQPEQQQRDQQTVESTLELAQLTSVERKPPEAVDSTPAAGACLPPSVQQMRLTNQQDQERACVM